MSEIRQDPMTGRCVIIAQDRANRPHAFVCDPPMKDDAECPFCAGRESETPSAIATYPPEPPSGAEPWWVRVVPNKYPAMLKACGDLPPSDAAPSSAAAGSLDAWKSQEIDHGQANAGQAPLFCAEVAFGSHEVIVESPQHVVSITELDEPLMTLLFRVYRDRLQALRSVGEVQYALAFKNVRSAAGASLSHSHSQVLTTPFVPHQVALELAQSQQHFSSHGRCLVCDLVQDELSARVRMVAETPRFVAWCPFASRCPFELCIAPREHSPHYDTASDEALDEIALLVRDLVQRLEKFYPHAAYNYLLHTSPFDAAAADHYHWHIELLPRLIKFAGFEWGSGCYINPVPPELAADKLRSAGTARQ